MSINPILETGPAHAPYFLSEELVFGPGVPFSLISGASSVVSLTTAPNVAPPYPLFSTTGTTYYCQQGGLYNFTMMGTWTTGTLPGSYQGFTSVNAVKTTVGGVITTMSPNYVCPVPIVVAGQVQSYTFTVRMQTGDQIYFLANNFTNYSYTANIQFIKIYLVSAF